MSPGNLATDRAAHKSKRRSLRPKRSFDRDRVRASVGELTLCFRTSNIVWKCEINGGRVYRARRRSGWKGYQFSYLRRLPILSLRRIALLSVRSLPQINLRHGPILKIVVVRSSNCLDFGVAALNWPIYCARMIAAASNFGLNDIGYNWSTA